ncbi:hypothetical protein C475_20957 [Halosimplex carlsbadense 2-9-1]|uniref:Uncharacterized protein n=1 Tax=Halosimplex carlsbadense 2-9-1 TaxID=797114 RepID=M0CCB3_9EURY|nr:hypothetical protein [Halosimplex carlsbadense]ELZ20283.1 hypothetical protein C475_20957 [Halosimplex carlsbadense 2-9-1]
MFDAPRWRLDARAHRRRTDPRSDGCERPGHTDRDAFGPTDPLADTESVADTDGYSDTDADSDTDAYGDADSDPDTDAYGDTDADPDTDGEQRLRRRR